MDREEVQGRMPLLRGMREKNGERITDEVGGEPREWMPGEHVKKEFQGREGEQL